MKTLTPLLLLLVQNVSKVEYTHTGAIGHFSWSIALNLDMMWVLLFALCYSTVTRTLVNLL